MADILIRGMAMPTCCLKCPLNSDSVCLAIDGCTYDNTNGTSRRGDCPLVPIPEGHGRLGDLETAEAILHNKAFDLAGTSAEYNALNWALRQIKALPTIIEADLEWKMKNCCCFSNTDQAEGGTEDGN